MVTLGVLFSAIVFRDPPRYEWLVLHLGYRCIYPVQTRTRAGLGFNAGVKDYRLTYYMDDYKVMETDLLAAFRVVPQPGVPPEEAGAAIAAESSTGTWTTVWTDGLTSLDRYKGR